jgi:hypothetical protein
VQLIQGICESPKLIDDVPDERSADLRLSVVLPKFPQVPPIRPSKHKVALSPVSSSAIPSSDSRNELDDILVVEFVSVNMGLDLPFPLFVQLAQFLFIVSVDLFDLLDGNIGAATVELVKV